MFGKSLSDVTVYLCGGINGLSDADAKDWREQAKLRLPKTLDPMRRDYRGREAENVNEIVHGDLRDIADSDFILAMCARPSWGTAMEIFHSFSIGKPVFSVVEDIESASPWLRYHSSGGLFHSLDTAIDAINRRTDQVITTIAKHFTFEAAHCVPTMPEHHICRRMHGHSYRAEFRFRGETASSGLCCGIDYADIAAVWARVNVQIDHRLLNDVPGLEVPTTENVAVWIANEFRAQCGTEHQHLVDAMTSIRVYESDTTWCELDVTK